MRINHNVTAMNTANNLYNVNTSQAKVLERLGSGQKINKAGDDSAGLAISEKMRGEIAQLKQQKANQQDLVSFTNAQDGTLNEISNILVSMQQLITQSGDGVANSSAVSGSVMMNATATGNIAQSMNAYVEAAKKFLTSAMNSVSLLSDANITKVGATDSAGALGQISNLTSMVPLASITCAVDAVNTLRASLGAKSNQAEATVRNLSTQIENLQEAESRIRDTDMAETTIDFQKNNILNNAATSMLAQANQQPQSVLSLLR
jgi:flagellin